MEARTGKRVSIPTLRHLLKFCGITREVLTILIIGVEVLFLLYFIIQISKAAAERMSCYVVHLLLKSALVTCPNNSFSLMKAPKMNVLFHADTDIHM